MALLRLRQTQQERAQVEARCRELQGELESVRLENAELSQKAHQPLNEPEKTELLRLRNRVAQFGTATNELEQLRRETRRLRAENQELRALPATAAAPQVAAAKDAELVLKQNWAFVGYATPEDAFQSMIWAMNEGNLATLLESLTPEERAAMVKNWADKPGDQIALEKRQQMDDVSGFRILNRREIGREQIALTIYAEGKGDSVGVLFQRNGNDWKMAGKTNRR